MNCPQGIFYHYFTWSSLTIFSAILASWGWEVWWVWPYWWGTLDPCRVCPMPAELPWKVFMIGNCFPKFPFPMNCPQGIFNHYFTWSSLTIFSAILASWGWEVWWVWPYWWGTLDPCRVCPMPAELAWKVFMCGNCLACCQKAAVAGEAAGVPMPIIFCVFSLLFESKMKMSYSRK